MSKPQATRRARPLLLGLLWVWALLMFLMVDLFKNVSEFDGFRPRSETYRAMRFTAHEMIGEAWLDGGFGEAPLSSSRTEGGLGGALGAVDEARSAEELKRIVEGGGDNRVRIRAARELATRFSRDAVPILVAVARDGRQPEKLRAQAARFLGRTGGDALPDLAALAGSGPESVRRGALLGLADLGTADAARRLFALRAEDALARVSNPAAIPALADVAGRSAAACTALGSTGAAAAAAPLLAVLEERALHPRIRAAAAEALGRLGRLEGLEAVRAATTDPHEVVAREATRAEARIVRFAE